MIVYFDSSALVKKYVAEEGTEGVLRLWKEAEGIAISQVGYAEIVAALGCKKREGELKPEAWKRLTKSIKSDWETFIRVDVSPLLHARIDVLVARYPLRGFDAIHLASALFLRESLGPEFVFVCTDTRLVETAKAEGLRVEEPGY